MASIDEVLTVVNRIEANQSIDHSAIAGLTSRVNSIEPRIGALETSQPALPPMRAPSPSLTQATVTSSEELSKQTPLLTRSNALTLGVFLAILFQTLISTLRSH